MARLFNTAAWVDIALLVKTLNKMIDFFLEEASTSSGIDNLWISTAISNH